MNSIIEIQCYSRGSSSQDLNLVECKLAVESYKLVVEQSC